MPSRFRHRRAFTLIELIMTMLLVGIVAGPLSLMLLQHVQSVFASGDYAIAANLARFEMEVVNNTPYANISSATFSNYQGYNYDLTRNVAFVQGGSATAEGLKKITVSITLHGGGRTLVTLTTYVAKNISYGL